jgi:hypothetical protein
MARIGSPDSMPSRVPHDLVCPSLRRPKAGFTRRSSVALSFSSGRSDWSDWSATQLPSCRRDLCAVIPNPDLTNIPYCGTNRQLRKARLAASSQAGVRNYADPGYGHNRTRSYYFGQAPGSSGAACGWEGPGLVGQSLREASQPGGFFVACLNCPSPPGQTVTCRL